MVGMMGEQRTEGVDGIEAAGAELAPHRVLIARHVEAVR